MITYPRGTRGHGRIVTTGRTALCVRVRPGQAGRAGPVPRAFTRFATHAGRCAVRDPPHGPSTRPDPATGGAPAWKDAMPATRRAATRHRQLDRHTPRQRQHPRHHRTGTDHHQVRGVTTRGEPVPHDGRLPAHHLCAARSGPTHSARTSPSRPSRPCSTRAGRPGRSRTSAPPARWCCPPRRTRSRRPRRSATPPAGRSVTVADVNRSAWSKHEVPHRCSPVSAACVHVRSQRTPPMGTATSQDESRLQHDDAGNHQRGREHDP